MWFWENVCEFILKLSVLSFVYEEGSLVKCLIWDFYNKDINEVLVLGDEGYCEVKDFMCMFMLSYVKNVQFYWDLLLLFICYGVELQLDVMFLLQVIFWLGGYIVINQIEVLVFIDVNFGKLICEYNIEDIVFVINFEVVEEVVC